mmetsp:Transcript_22592/g.49047  ORF Transcript_22592/g.49047 Transcript_22592/m.49047 type:complete len:609 (-) Transcript_22592:52-1878(-)
MREVAVYICPQVYDCNTAFVSGLRKNDIDVERFDAATSASDGYAKAVVEHNKRLASSSIGSFSQYRDYQYDDKEHSKPSPTEDFHFLCIAIEDSRIGVRSAKAAGMCVVGIGSNDIELDRLRAQGAHAVASSVSELLRQFGVRNYYQIQYLPYSIYLRDIANRKVGYPVSLLDTLRGRFVTTTADVGDVEDDEFEESPDHPTEHAGSTRRVELDMHANRIIPREVLGIQPGTLADVYINNVGWPQDKIDTVHFNARGLEMDIIRMFAKLYDISTDDMRGYLTSGGTEGNFTGLWWQRDHLRDVSGGYRPILLTSDQTHYSVAKAAEQLDIEGRLIKTTETGSIDCVDLKRVLHQISAEEPHRAILMIVNIGTTQTGALDDLPCVHELLETIVQRRGGHYSIHMDAALMGAVIPIIQPFGKDIDYFKDYAISTIAISGHKFFGSVSICGVLLTNKQFLDECFARKDVGVRYLTGLHDITPSGSRSGFSVLSFHNTLCGLYLHTDSRRLKDVVWQCYKNVDYFVEQMSAVVGKQRIIHPDYSLTVCFPRPSESIMIKWSLMPVSMPRKENDDDGTFEYAGVCILVNVDTTRIDNFLTEYVHDEKVRRCLQ